MSKPGTILTLSDLARRLGITPQSATQLVEVLERPEQFVTPTGIRLFTIEAADEIAELRAARAKARRAQQSAARTAARQRAGKARS